MSRQQHDKIYRHVKWTYITRGMQLDEVEIPTLHSVCGQPSGCEVTLFLGEIITQLKISAMSFRTYFSAKCDRKYKSFGFKKQLSVVNFQASKEKIQMY